MVKLLKQEITYNRYVCREKFISRLPLGILQNHKSALFIPLIRTFKNDILHKVLLNIFTEDQ